MREQKSRRMSWWPLLVAVAVVGYALLQMMGGSLDLRRLGRDEVWQEMQARGVLRVGMEASYPPFEYVDEEGVVQGFDAHLARALGERWGVAVQFVDVHYDGLVEALAAGKFDLIISALPYEPRLTRDVAYSRPYVYQGLQVVSRAVDGPVEGVEGLQSKVVAVELGSEAHQYLSLQMRDHGLVVEIRAERTLDEAVEMMRRGEVFAVVCDRVSAAPLTRADDLVGSERLLTADPIVIAVPTDAPTLLREVDTALEALEADGILDQLVERWF